MADRFLREVSNMHRLRKDIRSLPLANAEEFMKRLGDDAADDWVFRARDAQLPPIDLDWCWLFLGGRGTGKSHSMSAAVHIAVRAGINWNARLSLLLTPPEP
jgi:phage terminase large subunit-like protein